VARSTATAGPATSSRTGTSGTSWGVPRSANSRSHVSSFILRHHPGGWLGGTRVVRPWTGPRSPAGTFGPKVPPDGDIDPLAVGSPHRYVGERWRGVPTFVRS